MKWIVAQETVLGKKKELRDFERRLHEQKQIQDEFSLPSYDVLTVGVLRQSYIFRDLQVVQTFSSLCHTVLRHLYSLCLAQCPLSRCVVLIAYYISSFSNHCLNLLSSRSSSNPTLVLYSVLFKEVRVLGTFSRVPQNRQGPIPQPLDTFWFSCSRETSCHV